MRQPLPPSCPAPAWLTAPGTTRAAARLGPTGCASPASSTWEAPHYEAPNCAADSTKDG